MNVTMKKLLIALSLVVMVESFSIRAENQTQPIEGVVVLQHRPILSKRPKTPSTLYVECEYGNGYLSFTLPENVSTLNYRLYKDEEEISGMVTSEDPYAVIPSLHGEYNIECVDDGYRTYIGVLNFH